MRDNMRTSVKIPHEKSTRLSYSSSPAVWLSTWVSGLKNSIDRSPTLTSATFSMQRLCTATFATHVCRGSLPVQSASPWSLLVSPLYLSSACIPLQPFVDTSWQLAGCRCCGPTAKFHPKATGEQLAARIIVAQCRKMKA